MRFGRRGSKGRGRETMFARRDAGRADESNVIELPVEGNTAPAVNVQDDTTEEDTQEILTHLGQFARECSNTERALWSDACMNQLITCMEIAIEQEWSELNSMLSDTGRILQTYEVAQCPEQSVEFLQQAYQMLCRLVGDIVIDKDLSHTMTDWSAIHVEAVDALTDRGLTLYDDADESETESDERKVESVLDTIEEDSSQAEALFDEVEGVSGPESIAENTIDDTLADLEPLAPLAPLDELDDIPAEEVESNEPEQDNESFASFDMPRRDPVSPGVEPETSDPTSGIDDSDVDSLASITDVMDEAMEELEELPAIEEIQQSDAELVDEEELEVYDPPRIVVDIIDRICDIIAQFEQAELEARTQHLRVLSGGLEALAHEAHLMDNTVAGETCASMMQACESIRNGRASDDEAFVEVGFAFCGIFIEALTDPTSVNVSDWKRECQDWLDAEPVAEPTPEPIETVAEVVAAPEKEVVDARPTLTLYEPTPDAEESEVAAVTKVENETTSAPETDSSVDDLAATSQALLQAAQEAAAKGNGDDAKSFALRAAAEIARTEVIRAEEGLRECEIKHAESVQGTDEARKSVKTCEESVRDAETMVNESRSGHAESQQVVTQVTEELDTLESGVVDLNRQIQELQALRDEEVEKVSKTVHQLEEAKQIEMKRHAESEELKSMEEESRMRLEESRQHVKDKQRIVQTIESEMERAREQLTQQKVSHSDINQAIQQISGAAREEIEDQKDGMLF